jgi:hypothetical protein
MKKIAPPAWASWGGAVRSGAGVLPGALVVVVVIAVVSRPSRSNFDFFRFGSILGNLKLIAI